MASIPSSSSLLFTTIRKEYLTKITFSHRQTKIRPHKLPTPVQIRNFQIVSCLPPPTSTPFNPSTKLFVSGLSFRTTEESLRKAFKNFGNLVEVNIVMDRLANRPKGFAFLRYDTEEESKKAIEGMHGKFLDGRVIFIEVAKPRSQPHQGLKQNLEQ